MIEYVDQIVSNLNQEKACDVCWVFSAPLSESSANIRQVRDDECECVHVYITNLQDETSNVFGRVFHSVSNKRKSTTIRLYAVMEAKLSENNWDEIKGYDISKSRWEKYLKPIKDCLTEDAFSNWCEILGYPLRISRFRSEIIPNPNLQDRNFVGWQFDITFQEQIKIK